MDKLSFIKSKIYYDKDDIKLKRKLAYYRFKNQKIVFTNGCFDILHKGHIEYLAKASDYGNVLMIGLNSNESVKRIKGNGRPINTMENRALILSALEFVSHIIIFEEDTPYNLINLIKPDILVKGADYQINEIVGADIVKTAGGEVITIDLVENFSTSGIINKIKQL